MRCCEYMSVQLELPGVVSHISGEGSTTCHLSNTMTDKGMGGRYVDFLYTICRYIATIHTDIVEKLTRSVEIVSKKN